MRGFTIIEVIVAVFLLTVGVVGVFGVINQALSTTTILSDRLVASYLAQEGLEIARNIRDTNWLEGVEWSEGLPASPPKDRQGSYDFDQTAGLPVYQDEYMTIDSNGFYSHSPTGTPTKFKRKIHIEKPSADTREVTVTVYWGERGRTHEFIAQETLYNWR